MLGMLVHARKVTTKWCNVQGSFGSPGFKNFELGLLPEDPFAGFHSRFGFYKSVVADSFGYFAKLILCFFSAVYFLIISDFLKDYKLTSFEYLLILLFAIIGLLLLCTSNNLLSAYLAIELVSLSSYLLAAFKKNSSYSVEAGIKYLIIGSISSAFLLLGSSFIYLALGTI